MIDEPKREINMMGEWEEIPVIEQEQIIPDFVMQLEDRRHVIISGIPGLDNDYEAEIMRHVFLPMYKATLAARRSVELNYGEDLIPLQKVSDKPDTMAMDANTEAAITAVLHEAEPDCEVVTEEEGDVSLFERDDLSGVKYYVDPYDGSSVTKKALEEYSDLRYSEAIKLYFKKHPKLMVPNTSITRNVDGVDETNIIMDHTNGDIYLADKDLGAYRMVTTYDEQGNIRLQAEQIKVKPYNSENTLYACHTSKEEAYIKNLQNLSPPGERADLHYTPGPIRILTLTTLSNSEAALKGIRAILSNGEKLPEFKNWQLWAEILGLNIAVFSYPNCPENKGSKMAPGEDESIIKNNGTVDTKKAKASCRETVFAWNPDDEEANEYVAMMVDGEKARVTHRVNPF